MTTSSAEIPIQDDHQIVQRGQLDSRTLTLLNAFENLNEAIEVEKQTGTVSDTLSLAKVLAMTNGYAGHPREAVIREQQAQELQPHLVRIKDTIVSYKVLLGYLLIYADREGLAQSVGYDNVRDWCYALEIERDLVESAMKIARVYPFFFQMGMGPEEIIRKNVTPTHAAELIGLQNSMQRELTEQKYAILEQEYPEVIQDIQQRLSAGGEALPSADEEGTVSEKKKKIKRAERLDQVLRQVPVDIHKEISQKAFDEVLPVSIMRTNQICSQKPADLIKRHEKVGERRKPLIRLINCTWNRDTGMVHGEVVIDRAGYEEGLALERNIYNMEIDIEISNNPDEVISGSMSDFGRGLTTMCLPGQFDFLGGEVPDQPDTSYIEEEDSEEEEDPEEDF